MPIFLCATLPGCHLSAKQLIRLYEVVRLGWRCLSSVIGNMQEMLRVISFVLVGFFLTFPAFAADPPRIAPRPMASAFDAMEAGRWDVAKRLAERSDTAGATLIEWHRLRAGQGTPSDVMAFLKAHSDWPGLASLRTRHENAIARSDAETILAFYEESDPLTGTGALALARALKQTGRNAEAELTVVLAWRTLDLTSAEHDAFMQDWGALLKAHHKARLDMALWRGLRDVELMLPLVDKQAREVAQTRQMIEAGKAAGLVKLSQLPDSAKLNPHIAYVLFNRHVRSGKTEKAVEIILRQSRLENGLGQPERWAGWRRVLARDHMFDGKVGTAYDLASVHGLMEGANYADLEWLAGFLALTDLEKPADALNHFQKFMAAVETPISLGRAGYWIGRAQEVLGNAEGAALGYELGALHQTSYYGLLAAERGGFPPDPSLAGDEVFPNWRDASFVSSDVFKAGILALSIGRETLAERFFRHMALGLDRTELGQLGNALGDIGSDHLQVMVAKTAARQGVTLPGPYFPRHPLEQLDLPVPAELALAIARRESEFDQSVQSGAGAMGLMQLMPATAAEMASHLGERNHTRGRVFQDWQYNARLGSEYLSRMASQFGGNIVMMAAAYNAGPSRPLQWIERFGDPRVSNGDIVDWIEHIPFKETRNYVMRVTESLPVYRARLGIDPHPVPFSKELIGSTFAAALD